MRPRRQRSAAGWIGLVIAGWVVVSLVVSLLKGVGSGNAVLAVASAAALLVLVVWVLARREYRRAAEARDKYERIKREGLVRRHSSGVVLEEYPGVVPREPTPSESPGGPPDSQR